jgi:SAM-dependent methyltransferase
MSQAVKARVRGFWDSGPCGAKHASAPEGTPEFFAQVERRRRELEPFIDRYANFAGAAGQRLLEVGVGLGTDLVRFARAGAIATGIDLSPHSVELVRRRLEQEGLEAEVSVGDAERLPFPDGAFQRVYSWGVLHHTPDTPAAVRELVRVLAPGGELCAMLYARRSWVAYALWARHALLRGRPHRGVADVLAHHRESEGTQAFAVRELRQMFGGLDDLRIEHVGTPYDRRVAGPLAATTGRWLGWFVVIRGTGRPAPPPAAEPR